MDATHFKVHSHAIQGTLHSLSFLAPSGRGAFRNTLAATPMQSGTTPSKGVGDVLVRNPGPGVVSSVSVLYTGHIKEPGVSFYDRS